ncbi:DDE-type integrase/transposase/recombinase [Brachybacterium squillarum]|uniref:DDE-type integrase/transposase/recombinase n=1 Tax=Brachybacterium squillarum TaxID=661979 RepID=UPI002222F0C2|nr:DDE-type integrase/transposase/recombinase [Brachybacterium squillarum]MCW1804141.1 DDE-type integrase/transposase/recombinase [Brachybacterium squillarum]
MSAESLDTSVGARLWYEGAAWTVVELDGPNALLRAGDQFKKVHAPSLVGIAESLDLPTVQDARAELDAVVLASLSTTQRDDMYRTAKVFDELVLATSEYSVNDRYEAAADALGISVRTAYRRGLRYAELGIIGLVDTRLLQPHRPAVDPEWDSACREALDSYRDQSNPSMKSVLNKTNALYIGRNPQGTPPSRAVAYRRLRELDKGRYTFGAAKQRRSVAERPQGVLGRLRADRPGQYVVLDTTPLDVFAMEPLTGRWVNTELTVAMDLYSRCILGLVLRPISTTAQDVAAVMFQVVTPQTWGPPSTEDVPAPYVGVPETLLAQQTGTLPDTIVVDHGKVYLSQRTRAVCQRLGINIQPAIPHKPTDKPTIERFFRTLRQQLLEHLAAYKGPDIYSRGKDIEDKAFYHVPELEAILREWVGIYHHTTHQGLCDPLLPNVELSPAEMFARGMATAGVIRLPASDDLRMEFLDVAWRSIQHYGVEIDGRRYDGPALNLHRGARSHHGGAHAGKWPIMVDRDDVRTVYFQDPDTRTWHDLVWEHASGLDAPLSSEAAAYTRKLSRQSDRHVDAGAALDDLLERYSKGTVTSRREKNLARRLAAQPAKAHAASTARDVPSVIDLATHLERRRAQAQVADDLDVFEQYYTQHPEADGLEVFDE